MVMPKDDGGWWGGVPGGCGSSTEKLAEGLTQASRAQMWVEVALAYVRQGLQPDEAARSADRFVSLYAERACTREKPAFELPKAAGG